MKGKTCLKLAPALLTACVMGAALAKLPAPTEDQKAAAAAKKAAATAAAAKSKEALGKAQDRAVDNYRKAKGMQPMAAEMGMEKKMK